MLQGGEGIDFADVADGDGGAEQADRDHDQEGQRDGGGFQDERDDRGGQGAQAGGHQGAETRTDEQDECCLSQCVAQQIATGAADRADDGQVVGALHGPDGEEAAHHQHRDPDQQPAHQVQRTLLGGESADGVEGRIAGDRAGAGGQVDGGGISGAGVEGDGGDGVDVGDLLPGADVGVEDGQVTEGRVGDDAGHHHLLSGDGDGVADLQVRIVGQGLGGGDLTGAGGAAGQQCREQGGVGADHRGGRGGVRGLQPGGGDPERMGGPDTGHRRDAVRGVGGQRTGREREGLTRGGRCQADVGGR